MSNRYQVQTVISVLVVICCGLTGCEPAKPIQTTEPSVSSVPTESPSTTPSPTPIPASSDGPGRNIPVPKMPDSAHDKSEKGAIAFTDFYFRTVNYSLETYDPEPLVEISSRSCYLCGDFLIDPIRRNSDRGNWQVGGKYEVDDFVAHQSNQENYTVSFLITRERKTMYDSSGERVEDSPAFKAPIGGAATLSYDGGWILESLKFENQS